MAIRDNSSYAQDRIFKYTEVKILNGQTESESIHCLGGVLVRYVTPAGMTGTSFTFKVSDDGVTFKTYKNTAGNVVTAAVNAGDSTGIKPVDFAGVQHVKFVSSSAEGADRDLTLILRGI